MIKLMADWSTVKCCYSLVNNGLRHTASINVIYSTKIRFNKYFSIFISRLLTSWPSISLSCAKIEGLLIFNRFVVLSVVYYGGLYYQPIEYREYWAIQLTNVWVKDHKAKPKVRKKCKCEVNDTQHSLTRVTNLWLII